MTLWVADLVIRATLLLAVAALLAAWLRHAPAASRHLVWLTGLTGVLMLPVSTLLLPKVVVPVPASLVADAVIASNVGERVTMPARRPMGVPLAREYSRSVAVPAVSERPLQSVMSERDDHSGAGLPSPAQMVTGVWLLGVLVLLGRLAGGVLFIRRLARSADPVDDQVAWTTLADVMTDVGVRRPIRLLTSPRISVPLTWGWRVPVIMVPAAARDWSPARWRVVLLHEATHVRRRDWVSHLLAQSACGLHWFNPFVWLSARRLRLEGERACDEGVLSAGTRASDYAEHLLEIASTGRRVDWVAPATVGMARRGQLERRLVAILSPSRGTSSRSLPRSARVGYAATACVGFAMLMAAAVQPVAGAGQGLPSPAPVAPVTDLIVPVPAPVPVPPIPPALPALQPAPVEAPRAVERRRDSRTDQLDGIRTDQLEEVRRVMEQAREQGRTAQARVREQLERAHAQLEAVRADLPFNVDLDLDFDFDPDVFVQLPNFQLPDVPRGTMDTGVADAFINALRDTEPDVRRGAAEALGRYRVETAVAPLSRALDDENADVREAAARALGRIRSGDALKGLLGALDDRDVQVRTAAISALASLRSADAVPGLIRALQDPEPDIAAHAARALGAIRDPATLDSLLAATRHADPDVVGAAIRSLAGFSDQRAIDALTAATKHADPEIRRLAINILARSRYVTVECRDGIDNDGDGLIDAADRDCR